MRAVKFYILSITFLITCHQPPQSLTYKDLTGTWYWTKDHDTVKILFKDTSHFVTIINIKDSLTLAEVKNDNYSLDNFENTEWTYRLDTSNNNTIARFQTIILHNRLTYFVTANKKGQNEIELKLYKFGQRPKIGKHWQEFEMPIKDSSSFSIKRQKD